MKILFSYRCHVLDGEDDRRVLTRITSRTGENVDGLQAVTITTMAAITGGQEGKRHACISIIRVYIIPKNTGW